jgi:hypothetical protein
MPGASTASNGSLVATDDRPRLFEIDFVHAAGGSRSSRRHCPNVAATLDVR